jgi:hypothetical protein
VYAAQAMNREAGLKACEIRIRAERRSGEILKEMKGTGSRRARDGQREVNVEQRDIETATH